MATERENQVTDKPMEERRREILRTVRQYLIRDMNVKEILRHMPHVFTPAEEEKIKSVTTRTEQCEIFLEILPRRGDKAFDEFKEALKKVSPHLKSTLDQAEEINIERQTSAKVRGKLQCLEKEKKKVVDERDELERKLRESDELLKNGLKKILELADKTKTTEEINLERQRSAGLQGKIRYLEKELKKVADERDELKKQLDESNEQLKNDLKTLLEDLLGKMKTIEELTAVLEDERKKKEKIEKDRDELTKKLQDKEEELTNAFKKQLIEVVNEKGTATGQTELTDLDNNELQPSPTVRGLEITTEENTCTEEEKVKTIFRQLEHYRKQEMQLFVKAKELIENYFENTSADLEGNSQGALKKNPNTNQESKSLLKTLEKERELVLQKNKLQSKKEDLGRKLKEKEKSIKERDEKLSEFKKRCDHLQQQSDSNSGRVIELQESLRKWQARSETLEDEIRKSRIFLNGIFLPFDDRKPRIDVIHHLTNNTSAKPKATRSTDGSGEAIDVLLNRKGPTCGTEQKPNSWWWIDLGENHLLFITHYALTNQKGDPALAVLQLKGSTDGHDWHSLTKTHIKDHTDSCRLTTTWRVNGKMPGYRYFKIVRATNGIHLSAIWLYGVLLEIKA